MSSNSVFCSFYASTHHYKDDELAGWFTKLKEEFSGEKGFVVELDSKFKDRRKHRENYMSAREVIKNSFATLSKNLEKIGNKKNDVDKDAIREIKDNIRNFDLALNEIQNFISEAMYDSKLQYILLKLKAILHGIANYFFGGDLQSSRVIIRGDCVLVSSGPANHVTPVYILPDRPSISLFFSEQIYKEIDTIEKNLSQHNP